MAGHNRRSSGGRALIPGVSYEGWGTLLGASLLLGIINAFVRPILLLLSLPFIIVTMGLFIFVINALLLMLVSKIIPAFQVPGFGARFLARSSSASSAGCSARSSAAATEDPCDHPSCDHQAGQCARH